MLNITSLLLIGKRKNVPFGTFFIDDHRGPKAKQPSPCELGCLLIVVSAVD
jgi:hypothetical protein